MWSARLIAMLLGLATFACVDTPRLVEPEVDSSHVIVREMPEAPISKLDLLIVVDDTAAMAPYQDRLAIVTETLADTLDELVRDWTDLQVAVVTNDGRLRHLPGSQEAFLVDSTDYSYTHEQNYPGALHDAITTLMAVGVASSVPSQPLEAVRRALESHSGLVRDRSALGIITIGATDDASPWPVAEYVRWTQALMGGSWRRDVIAVGINVTPAPRLEEYYDAIFAQMVSIEDGDLAAVRQLGRRLRWGVNGCLEEAPADVDPSTPGLQPDCSLHVVIDDELRRVPACTVATDLERAVEQAATLPTPACWSLVEDLQSCWSAMGPPYALELHGYTNDNHPAFRFECLTH